MGWFGWVGQAIQLFQLNGRDGLWLPPPTNKPTTHNSLSLPSTCLIEKRNEANEANWMNLWMKLSGIEGMNSEWSEFNGMRAKKEAEFDEIKWSELLLRNGIKERNGAPSSSRCAASQSKINLFIPAFGLKSWLLLR